MVIVGFNSDIIHCGAGNIAVEVVVVGILLEIKSRDETIHESVMAREMPVKFVNVTQDRREVPVDASSITDGAL